MPANEQTWRDQKRMHIVFGVSSLIMVLASVWMIAKDYVREWKDYQTSYFRIEKWTDQARIRQATAETESQLAGRRSALRSIQSRPVSAEVIEQFTSVVKEHRAAESEESVGEIASDEQKKFDELAKALAKASAAAEEARAKADAAHVQVVEAAAVLQAAGDETPEEGEAPLEEAETAVTEATAALEELEAERVDAEDQAIAARRELLAYMNAFVDEARRQEDALVREKKAQAALHTESVSLLDLAFAEHAPEEDITRRQQEIDAYKARMDDLDEAIAAAKGYRTDLEGVIRRGIREQELLAQKELDEVQMELNRLEASYDSHRTKVGDLIVRAPILEAFNTTELKIDNGWLPNLKINYNFSDVARFDRCATCHKAIDKTAPGSAVDPAYPTIDEEDRSFTVALNTPSEAPLESDTLESVYGLVLADEGQLDRRDVTIEVVFPDSLAARAGLEMGDVIEQIDGGDIYERELVRHYLFEAAQWGQPIEMTVRRGLPHPYTSHPRLDLYLGSLSPHPKGDMGCTICHDGQGSSTTFKYASHAPNSPAEADEWRREHGWFLNHHWIFPMMPKRFLESNCLKCHHDVVELMPSKKYPDPPAPKLVRGWELIKHYGCYGCHEINGYDGGERIGPDLRNEPNYPAVAQQILRDENLNDLEKGWASDLVVDPQNDGARNRLRAALLEDLKLLEPAQPLPDADATSEVAEPSEPRLSKTTHALADLLKDAESPGSLRQVGPSLRFLESKVDYEWLYSWIRRPADFRPTTKMPQFFGLHDHISSDHEAYYQLEGIEESEESSEMLTNLEFTKKMEAIEVRAITEYLLQSSSEFEFLSPPAEVTEGASAERGLEAFQMRGCLACHQHADFPEVTANQGPNLTGVGAKFVGEKGRRWLYSWLKQPNAYHVRTKMPDLFLDPIAVTDATGQPTGEITDPAADIVAFLLGDSHADWQPEGVPAREQLTAEERLSLETLALEWMGANFSRRKSKQYLQEGIPAEVGEGLKGDEKLFVGMKSEDQEKTMLMYVGRRGISKYGCFGCHDIPGFESAKPIGTALADWGRKEPAKLAFEQIGRFLETHGVHGDASSSHDESHDNPATSHSDHGGDTHGGEAEEAHDSEPTAHAAAGHGLDPGKLDADTGFFVMQLLMHERQGFLWQKLRMPRSYDYNKTRNKGYNERLRMPRFPLDAEQREAIMTFVLGLTAESPGGSYVYQPDERQKAINDGRIVLEKFNCGGCHILEMDRWQFDYNPEEIPPPITVENYPFLAPEFTAEEVVSSREQDRAGRVHADVIGMPTVDPLTGAVQHVDLDGLPIEPDDEESQRFVPFVLYEPALLNGEVFRTGQELLIPADREQIAPEHGAAHPAWGGDLARYLLPHAVAAERKVNPQANPGEAWGWLPPPLIGEGRKVQTDWLHDFLLDPHPIRPAVVLRMPRFNMSAEEAGQLADYFAAADNAEYPYEYNTRRRDSYLAGIEEENPEHLDQAMNIVVDQSYCVKCHSVGDFQVAGNPKALAPNLDLVYRRLRPDYVKAWIANPPGILPYTPMPVNIPYGTEPPHFGGVSQDLFPGTSIEQIDGLVNLLMNYDKYTGRRAQIAPLVQAAAESGAEDAATADQPTDTSAGGL